MDLLQGFQELDYLTLSIISMVSGILLLFGGHRFFRLSLALVVGFFFAWLGVFILNSIQIEISPKVFWGTSVGLFILGVILAFVLLKLALLIAGMVAGFFLGNFILSLGLTKVFNKDFHRQLFVYIFAFGFGILVFLFEKYIFTCIVPFIGSYLLFLGIDHFVQSNFSLVFQSIVLYFTQNENHFSITTNTALMLAGFLITALLGIFFHFRTRKSKK
ncbi:hypothetical protein HMI55_002905 [Coelomomyces lativittatus]|nr:hypothetical protein HMI56_003951 [Coelomomyces lativittatus]KAJ1502428.1 hypothetical protein HMI55_002905 [Coelomomyces lativittatus]